MGASYLFVAGFFWLVQDPFPITKDRIVLRLDSILLPIPLLTDIQS